MMTQLDLPLLPYPQDPVTHNEHTLFKLWYQYLVPTLFGWRIESGEITRVLVPMDSRAVHVRELRKDCKDLSTRDGGYDFEVYLDEWNDDSSKWRTVNKFVDGHEVE